MDLIEDFNPFAGRKENLDDLRVEFVFQGKQYGRWVGAMDRKDALQFVMLAENISPSLRRDLVRVTIKTRKELARWKPTNQKPAW
ncbi:MAG: hypothetical protein EBY29_10770 [Planctomycetes bacterium]|nr:hypothetical protein [Planctomycetota bacterium]